MALVISCLSGTKAEAKGEDSIVLDIGNVITINSPISEESVSKVVMKIESMLVKSVYIYISSPGGSIVAGQTLINAIKGTDKKIICIADFAASMAFSTFQSCDERLIVDHAIIMQHLAAYGLDTQDTIRQRSMVEFIEKLAHKLNVDDAARLGMPLEDFTRRIEKDWWIYDDEILQFKAADRKVNIRCTPALARKKVKEEIMTPFGTVNVVWSACPLVTFPLEIKFGGEFFGSDNEKRNLMKAVMESHDWRSKYKVEK
jgi:ATP-dependent protease ClpP protease subunit